MTMSNREKRAAVLRIQINKVRASMGMLRIVAVNVERQNLDAPATEIREIVERLSDIVGVLGRTANNLENKG